MAVNSALPKNHDSGAPPHGEPQAPPSVIAATPSPSQTKRATRVARFAEANAASLASGSVALIAVMLGLVTLGHHDAVGTYNFRWLVLIASASTLTSIGMAGGRPSRKRVRCCIALLIWAFGGYAAYWGAGIADTLDREIVSPCFSLGTTLLGLFVISGNKRVFAYLLWAWGVLCWAYLIFSPDTSTDDNGGRFFAFIWFWGFGGLVMIILTHIENNINTGRIAEPRTTVAHSKWGRAGYVWSKLNADEED